MRRGWKEVEDSDENVKKDTVERSSNGEKLEVAFNFDSDAILLGYPRYAEHTERLHRHHWKVKNSSLPAKYDCRIMENSTSPEVITHP